MRAVVRVGYTCVAMNVPRHVDLRLDARYIVPVEPVEALEGHAVLVDAGRIVAVVSAAEADRDFLPRERVRLASHVLVPGFVNAHTHAAMTLLRGIADDVPLKVWLEGHIWPREGRFVSPEFVHDGALLGAAEMLRGGTTCCNDMYFYPDASARAYQAAGIRAMLGLPVLDIPTPYAANADAYLQAGLAARDAFKHAPRLAFSLSPHAPYTVTDATWQKIVVFAHQLDLPIQTHLQETRGELDDALTATRASPLARLDHLGVTGPGFIAIHAVHLAHGDVDLLARHDCQVVHCPASNLKLASGIAPVASLQAHGINVALGTDGAASNNRLDMFAEMRLASLLAKHVASDAAAGSAAVVLRMATLGGARALGLDADIGSLVSGKQADIVAIDLDALETMPCYDPISHLVHAAGRESVTDVWVGGDRVVTNRRLMLVDEAALTSRVRAWRERLQ